MCCWWNPCWSIPRCLPTHQVLHSVRERVLKAWEHGGNVLELWLYHVVSIFPIKSTCDSPKMMVSMNGGYPKMDGLVHGKSHLEMDDKNRGTPMTMETPIYWASWSHDFSKRCMMNCGNWHDWHAQKAGFSRAGWWTRTHRLFWPRIDPVLVKFGDTARNKSKPADKMNKGWIYHKSHCIFKIITIIRWTNRNGFGFMFSQLWFFSQTSCKIAGQASAQLQGLAQLRKAGDIRGISWWLCFTDWPPWAVKYLESNVIAWQTGHMFLLVAQYHIMYIYIHTYLHVDIYIYVY